VDSPNPHLDQFQTWIRSRASERGLSLLASLTAPARLPSRATFPPPPHTSRRLAPLRPARAIDGYPLPLALHSRSAARDAGPHGHGPLPDYPRGGDHSLPLQVPEVRRRRRQGGSQRGWVFLDLYSYPAGPRSVRSLLESLPSSTHGWAPGREPWPSSRGPVRRRCTPLFPSPLQISVAVSPPIPSINWPSM
jgi:hypothetical protein